MSFQFGSLNTAIVPGMVATLKAWPSPSLKAETVDALDGVFYARTGLGAISFEFDVLLRASTPVGVHALRDQLVAACAPELGLQALTPETGDGWVWWATASGLDDFTRGLWVKGVECQLRGQVTFLVPDGVGWASPDETASGTTSATLTRAKGNLASHPTITIQGAYSKVTVTIGALVVDVDVPLAAGQRLVLDYQAMDFGVWAGPTKVAHAAPGMSTFVRPALPLGAITVSTAATGGAVSSVSVAANSRRG